MFLNLRKFRKQPCLILFKVILLLTFTLDHVEFNIFYSTIFLFYFSSLYLFERENTDEDKEKGVVMSDRKNAGENIGDNGDENVKESSWSSFS